MSLLLDALQRASKEKEKLSEGKTTRTDAASVKEDEPREPFPAIALENAIDEPKTESRPELSMEPLAPLPEPAPVRREPVLDPVLADLAEVDTMPSPSAESAKALVDEVPITPAASIRQVLAAEEPSEEATVSRTAAGSAGVTGTVAVAAPLTRGDSAVPATAQSAGLGSTGRAPGPGQRASEISPEIAREILGATVKPKPRVMTVALLVIAFLVMGAYAAFLGGAFDRVLGTRSSSLVPANPPPAPQGPTAGAALDPAPKPEPPVKQESPSKVQADGRAILPATAKNEVPKTREASQSAAAAEAPSPADQPRRSGGRAAQAQAKQVVVTRSNQPGELDQAYQALTEGRFADARTLYGKVLEKNASERDALLGLAYLAHKERDSETARAYYQKVLRLDPNNAVATSGLLAIAADGDFAQAAARAREFADRSPDSAPALAALGAILVREGRIAEAQQAYFKALTLEPENPLHAFNLAVALDRLHKYSQAEAFYERALKLAEKASAAEKAGIPLKEARQRLEELRQARPGTSPTTDPSGR